MDYSLLNKSIVTKEITHHHENYSSQRGVALLTILVMVCQQRFYCGTIAKRRPIPPENTGYLMRQDQSLLYAKSASIFQSYHSG